MYGATKAAAIERKRDIKRDASRLLGCACYTKLPDVPRLRLRALLQLLLCPPQSSLPLLALALGAGAPTGASC